MNKAGSLPRLGLTAHQNFGGVRKNKTGKKMRNTSQLHLAKHFPGKISCYRRTGFNCVVKLCFEF